MRVINKALFMDLDGTLIVTKSGKTFPKDKNDWVYNQNILQIVEQYVDQGYYVMIVSNQGGIEAGHITMNDFRYKMKKVVDGLLVTTGCPFSRLSYRFSVSNNPNDFYRKPNPGMGYDLALTHILDLSESVMVGDASGKVRSRDLVYKDESSPSGWSYRDGQYVADVDVKDILVDAIQITGTLIRFDFADSDLKFAKSCGMSYIDIEDFLKSKPKDNG